MSNTRWMVLGNNLEHGIVGEAVAVEVVGFLVNHPKYGTIETTEDNFVSEDTAKQLVRIWTEGLLRKRRREGGFIEMSSTKNSGREG